VIALSNGTIADLAPTNTTYTVRLVTTRKNRFSRYILLFKFAVKIIAYHILIYTLIVIIEL